MENRIYGISDQEFISLVRSSLNISEVLFKLNCENDSWHISQTKKRMVDLGLTGYDFKDKQPKLKKTIDPKKVFCENSKHKNRFLRSYIRENNLIPYKCAKCGISEWNGKTLSLELNHINGIYTDNRLENLQFLCPNCHSQVDTFGARNSKKHISRTVTPNEFLITVVCEFYAQVKDVNSVAVMLHLLPEEVNACLAFAGIKKTNQKYVIQYDKDKNIVNRFGSLSECCKWLIDNNIVKTKLIKTCKNTLKANAGKLWNNYYFEILDA
jgi:5-methylcytosine-specific restriction endonuclease McrA